MDVRLSAGQASGASLFQFPPITGTGLVTSITANNTSLPLQRSYIYDTYQAIVTGTGAVTATVTFQVSNDPGTGVGYPITVITANGNTAIVCANGSGWPNTIQVGQLITGPGIPAGTTVSAIPTASTITMSAAATASSPTQTSGGPYGSTTNIGTPVVFYNNYWNQTAIGTITLTGTSPQSDGFVSATSWRFVRAVVTNITGTGATVQVLQGA